MNYPEFPANNLQEWFQQLLDNKIFTSLTDIEELQVSEEAFKQDFETTDAYLLSKLRDKFVVNHISYERVVDLYVAYGLHRLTKGQFINKSAANYQLPKLNRFLSKDFNTEEMINFLIENNILSKEDLDQYKELFVKVYPNEETETSWGLHTKYVHKRLGFDNLELVSRYGGEGMGDNYWYVFHYKPTNEYIRFSGWYASHYGREVEEMELVKPVEVTITEYHTVK